MVCWLMGSGPSLVDTQIRGSGWTVVVPHPSPKAPSPPPCRGAGGYFFQKCYFWFLYQMLLGGQQIRRTRGDFRVFRFAQNRFYTGFLHKFDFEKMFVLSITRFWGTSELNKNSKNTFFEGKMGFTIIKTRFLKAKWVFEKTVFAKCLQNVLQNVLQKFLQNVLQMFLQFFYIFFFACVHVRARAEPRGVHTRARAHVTDPRDFGPIYHSASPYTSSCACYFDYLNELALFWEKWI